MDDFLINKPPSDAPRPECPAPQMCRCSRWRAAATVVAIFLVASAHAANDPVSWIAFIGCPADGQAGPLAPPSGDPVSATMDPRVGRQLAYYKAEQGDGVLAPKGWHCREWYGSAGGFLVVTPKEIPPPYFPAPKVTGPAIVVRTLLGDTSGRFDVAITAARLFPKADRDFIERVKAEGILPEKAFDVKPFAADVMHYLNDHMVEFTTPPGQSGLGTTGPLRASALPIRGIVMVELPDEDEMDIMIRLPAEFSALTRSMLDWASACLSRDSEECVK